MDEIVEKDSSGNDASFIVINGPLRGERYWVLEEQVMIGSDDSCGIVVEDPNVALHFAIAEFRDGRHYICPVTPEGIIVNEEHYDMSADIKLQRGDIIEFGPHKLRFVAEAKEEEEVEKKEVEIKETFASTDNYLQNTASYIDPEATPVELEAEEDYNFEQKFLMLCAFGGTALLVMLIIFLIWL